MNKDAAIVATKVVLAWVGMMAACAGLIALGRLIGHSYGDGMGLGFIGLVLLVVGWCFAYHQSK